jgi:hypothetical protein
VTGALLKKELREHKWIIGAAWALCGLILFSALKTDAGDSAPLAVFQPVVPYVAGILALIFANRFVVREYGARTHLFLEALPISRVRVFVVKWALSLLLTLLPLAGATAVILRVQRASMELSTGFMAATAARVLMFGLFAHAVAFAAGYIGRYRHVFWLGLVLGLFAFDQHGQRPMRTLPPFALVSDTLLAQRSAWPVSDLLWTLACVVLAIALAGTIALAAEGEVVTALSRRMSHREKIGVATAMLVPFFALSIADRRKPKPRFDLAQAVRSNVSDVAVGVARPDNVPQHDVEELGQKVATDLSGVRDYVGMHELPAIFIVPDASLDGDLFLRATLPAADGVVLKAPLGAKDFDETAFRAFAISEVLDWYTRGRSSIESRAWLLDGFALWWVARDEPVLDVRAAAAAQRLSVTPDTFNSWLTSHEALGDCLGDALAFGAMKVLAEKPDALRALVREAWQRPSYDLRAALDRSSGDALVRKHFGFGVDALAQRLRREPQAEEAPSVAADRMRGTTYEVRYAPPSSWTGPFSVRYLQLGPWAGELERSELGRVDATSSGVLPLTVALGARLFIAFERHEDALACTTRSGARRWTVP